MPKASLLLKDKALTHTLMHYLHKRRMTKTDLQKLDPAQIDQLIPALQTLAEIGQRYAEFDDRSRNDFEHRIRAKAGQSAYVPSPIVMGLQDTQRFSVLRDSQEKARAAHEDFVAQFTSLFPDIAARPIKSGWDWLDPSLQGDHILYGLAEFFSSTQLPRR